MNFENVLELVKVYSKTERPLRGEKLRKYTENKILTYIFYGGALVLGVLIGIFGGIIAIEKGMQGAVMAYFPIVPTGLFLALLFLTLWGRIRRMREEVNTEVSSWLPLTWEEHTMASSLVNILGLPLAVVLFTVSGTLSLSIVFGKFALGAVSLVSIVIAVFMASLVAEIFSTLVDRLMKKISGSMGRAGIWLRFLGMLGLGLSFYFLWFSFTQGGGAFVRSISEMQWKVWFIPSVWPGAALASFTGNNYAPALLFLTSAGVFEFGLFYLITRLKMKFEGVESAPLTLSAGDYSYGGGILEKLGFSPLKASLISKDFRAFTRRKRLMGILFAPLFFLVWPLLQGSGGISTTVTVPLMASTIMAAMLGGVALGSEGQAVWHLYSLPIAAEKLLKCKYYFVTICSLLLALGGCAVAFLAFSPPLSTFIVSLIESMVLAFVLPLVALRRGVSDAEFTETPKPKMVGGAAILLNFISVIIVGLAIVSPLIYLLLNPAVPISGIVGFIAVLISVALGLFFAYGFYRLDLREAEKFLREGEV